MMNKTYFSISLVTLLLVITTTGCSKSDSSAQQEMTDNFKALVMGGKDIDPNHTWSTGVISPIKVNVNLDQNATYTVFILLSDPLVDANAKYVGMAQIKGGESKIIYATVPSLSTSLYAACYDKDGHFTRISVTGDEITFSGELAQSGSEPLYNGMYYAFEFPDEKNIKDFDYNDLVLLVSTPHDNGNGSYTCFVSVAAVGTTMNTTLYYNGTQMGEEVHRVWNVENSEMINVKTVTSQPRYLGEITFNSADADIRHLPLSLHISDSNGKLSLDLSQPTTANQAPLYFSVNGDAQAKWRWCLEGKNIGLAFLNFSIWASNQQTATDWYNSDNASYIQVVPKW